MNPPKVGSQGIKELRHLFATSANLDADSYEERRIWALTLENLLDRALKTVQAIDPESGDLEASPRLIEQACLNLEALKLAIGGQNR